MVLASHLWKLDKISFDSYSTAVGLFDFVKLEFVKLVFIKYVFIKKNLVLWKLIIGLY